MTRKAVGLALIWVGVLAAVLAIRTGWALTSYGGAALRFMTLVAPVHIALIGSWWVVHDRRRRPNVDLPRVVRNAAWLARALGWLAVVQLGVVVLMLFVDLPVFIAMARAGAFDNPRGFDVQMGVLELPRIESALLALAATAVPVVAGFRAKKVLCGDAVPPLRRAVGVAALAFAIVVLVLWPYAWSASDAPPWIVELGFLLGGYAALLATQEWHVRAVAVVLSGGAIIVSVAVFLALGGAARDAGAAGEDEGAAMGGDP